MKAPSLLTLADIHQPRLYQAPLRSVQPHRVPPTPPSPQEGVGRVPYDLAEAEVYGGAAHPVQGRGVEAAEDHALVEKRTVLLDLVVEALQVIGRVTGITSRHRQLVQPPGLIYALVDAPSVRVANPQAVGGAGVPDVPRGATTGWTGCGTWGFGR